MSNKKNALATVALTGIAVAVSSAYAAGFQLTEQSSLSLGRAYAGAGIVGDDLSAVFYNAAGMTLLPGTQIQAGSVFIEVDAPFTGTNAAGQTFSENGRLKGQAIPAGYITHQVNDQLWLGLGMTVPYGMGTEWGYSWPGADKGNQSMIMTIDINPNIAYKVNDKLSIGGGISLQYAKAELGQSGGMLGDTNLIDAVVNGDSWHLGFNLGVMYQPTETLRFGLAYRSQIGHDAKGDLKLTGPKADQLAAAGLPTTYDDFGVRVTTPDTVMATATWEATQDLRLSGLVRWARWSNLDQLDIRSVGFMPLLGEPVKVNEYNWEDTWLFSVGADYRLNNEWTVRGGVAYETSAVGEAKDRPATIPDVDRVWFSLGATYNYSKQIQIDFGATWLMGVGNMDLIHENTRVNASGQPSGGYIGTAAGKKFGEFDSMNAYIIGAQVQYRF